MYLYNKMKYGVLYNKKYLFYKFFIEKKVFKTKEITLNYFQYFIGMLVEKVLIFNCPLSLYKKCINTIIRKGL